MKRQSVEFARISEELDAILHPQRGLVTAAVYQFGDFRLDGGRFELLRKGRAVRLERKPMELLILLLGSEGRLVTRNEIAEHLW